MAKIKCLVVDDSAVARAFLTQILTSDPDIEVLGSAVNGEEAVEAVRRLQPDVVLMDINMPRRDGLSATRLIMESSPRPIILVSGQENAGATSTIFAGMEAGALAVLTRPHGQRHPQHESEVRHLLRTVKTMSEVRVVRRSVSAQPAVAAKPITAPLTIVGSAEPGRNAVNGTGALRETGALPLLGKFRLVAIGASTGGPPLIRNIIGALPADFSLPVVVVQHMAAGFMRDFVAWLGVSTGYQVVTATEGELLLPGRVYVAPEDRHMLVNSGLRVTLNTAPQEHGMRPAVSCLFRSLTDSMAQQTLAVLLTGMGQDGSTELAELRKAGATTIAQDFASSVVHGMPGEAIKLGGATYIRSAEEIPQAIIDLARGARIG